VRDQGREDRPGPQIKITHDDINERIASVPTPLRGHAPARRAAYERMRDAVDKARDVTVTTGEVVTILDAASATSRSPRSTSCGSPAGAEQQAKTDMIENKI
jgi:hypothetical protein